MHQRGPRVGSYRQPATRSARASADVSNMQRPSVCTQQHRRSSRAYMPSDRHSIQIRSPAASALTRYASTSACPVRTRRCCTCSTARPEQAARSARVMLDDHLDATVESVRGSQRPPLEAAVEIA